MPVTPDPYALTDLAAAKEHLGIPATNVDFDDVVQRFINAATGKIETFCDRKFIRRSHIEYQDGFANDRILLAQWPADKPTELWIDPTGEFTDTQYQLAVDKYELDLSARGEGIGVVLTGSCKLFPKGRRNIKAVYTAGYADIASLPAEIEDACLWTVEFLYSMRNDRRIGVASKGKNQENSTFSGDLPEFVQKTLEAYKRTEWPTGSLAVFTG